jgi:hypothetical protein
MAESLVLREYQTEAVAATEKAWSEDMTRPGIVLPCGAGKTVIFSALAAGHRDERTMVLVHRDELANRPGPAGREGQGGRRPDRGTGGGRLGADCQPPEPP